MENFSPSIGGFFYYSLVRVNSYQEKYQCHWANEVPSLENYNAQLSCMTLVYQMV